MGREINRGRQLMDEEVEIVNTIQAHGKHLEALVAYLRNARNIHLVDQKWVSIGETDLQTGLMALTRAVAQPSTF